MIGSLGSIFNKKRSDREGSGCLWLGLLYLLLTLGLTFYNETSNAQTVIVPATNVSTNNSATILSSFDPVPINVSYGTAFGSIPFQTRAYVQLSNGGTESLAVTWDNTGYSSTSPGVFTIFGDYTLRTGLTNPFLVRATTTVTVQNQSFTEDFITSGTWLCPDGVTKVWVQCWAGGASGASVGTVNKVPGGGGGAYAADSVDVVAGNSYNYVVGAAVTPDIPSGSDADGLDGNNSTWNVTDVVAEGGRKATITNFGLGGQAVNSTGSIKFSGGSGSLTATSRSGGGGGGAGSNESGQSAIVVSGTSVTGGIGGTLSGGNGAGGSSGQGGAGSSYGGGGAGSRNTSIDNKRGGPGAVGHITISYSGSTTPPPAPGNVYIVAVRGQSNVVSPGNGSPGAPYTGALDTQMFINATVGFDPLEYSVNNNPGGSPTGLGPELSIATTIAALAPGETYIQKKGQSGTAMFNQWNVNVNSTGRSAVSTFTGSLDYLEAQGKVIQKIWVVFRQGEADQGASNAWGVGTYHYGTGVPSSGLGSNGDIYVDKVNNLLYGIKNQYGNTGWGTGFKLCTLTGSGTPAGGTGSIGNTYYDTVNDLFYFKTGASTWVTTSVINVAVRASYLDRLYALIKYDVDAINAAGFNTTTTTEYHWIDCLIDNPQTVDTTYTLYINAAKTNGMTDFPTDNISYAGKVDSFHTISVSDQNTIDGVHLNTNGEITMGLRAGALMVIP